MDNRVGEMQVFLRVVESGSFSEAARLLLMTPSTVSKLIGRIEERLGVRLLERSTRRLSLTAEGQIFYEKSLALLAELDEIERGLSQGAASAGGTVRVNASVAFGVLGLEPLLPAFWEAHPNIVVDVSLSDEIVDLYLDRTDVAFRVGALQDSAMIARRIGVARRKIVAAPRYIERRGEPRTVEDLAEHNCLGFNFRRAAPVWPLKEGGRIVDRVVGGPCWPIMARPSGGWRWREPGWRGSANTMSGPISQRAAWSRCCRRQSRGTRNRSMPSIWAARICPIASGPSSISSVLA